MAAGQARLIRVVVCACLLLLIDATGALRRPGVDGTAGVGRPGTYVLLAAETARPVKRIVSLVPALTEMLFAIGAGPNVVGVSNFDSFPPAVKGLPHVGALLDPDTERILTLRPDLVITYGSQTDAQSRFERAGIRVFTYRHGGIDGVLATMRELGETVGRTAEANAAARDLQVRLDSIRSRVKGRPRPRTLLVFERMPQTLRGLYVSGGTGFLNDMLDAAGAVNVFNDVKRESVQPSQETVLVRAPEVIVEIRAQRLANAEEARRDQAAWNILASLPAVRQRRVYFLSGDELVVPGPRLTIGVEAMARVLHPDAFR
jgi:iron complex transport system substrate-binding protein